MDRFGPEFKQYYAKTLDFHLEGDVGIGDLVYANTYWAQDDTWVNEYSEYMQYVNTGPPNNYTAPNRQSYTCLNGPTYSVPGTPLSGCNVPTQWYNYTAKVYRWSNELRLQSKEDGSAWFTGSSAVIGRGRARTQRLLRHSGPAAEWRGLPVLRLVLWT